jgi:hypothetical protein
MYRPTIFINSCFRWLIAATTALLFFPACASDTSQGGGDDTSTPAESGNDDESTTTADGDTSTTDPATSETTGDLKANGEACEEASECQGGFCTQTFGAKVCGECDSDLGCQESGAGLNCTLESAADPSFLRCSTGALGEDCESDAGCEGGKCHLVETDWGTFGVCGECRNDQECQDSGAGLACTDKENNGVTYPQCSSGALGEACEADSSCESMICADAGAFGGNVCSQCRADQDCVDAGTGKNCTAVEDDAGLTFLGCSSGMLGESCDSDAGCDGTKCASFGDAMICSNCAQDSDCAADQACALAADEDKNIRRDCVVLASVADDGLCFASGTSEVCVNHCVVAFADFNADLGVCSACRPDHESEDCAADEKCTPPSFDAGMLKGAFCEKK